MMPIHPHPQPNKPSGTCLFLSGEPGVGKSTLLARVIETLRRSTDWQISGLITHEILNAAGERTGFQTSTLDGSRSGVLAALQPNGKFLLNHTTMETLILPTIEEGMHSADLLVIDEIGSIQLQSEKFLPVIEQALSMTTLNILGTIALAGDPNLAVIRSHPRMQVVEITLDNRNGLVEDIAGKFLPQDPGN